MILETSILRMLALLAGGLLYAVVGCLFYFVDREARLLVRPVDYVHPKPIDFAFAVDPLKSYGAPFSDLTVATKDGQTIRGWFVPANRSDDVATIVLVHGRSGNRTSMMFLLPVLRRLGAAVVMVDLTENGLSDGNGRGTGLGLAEANDVDAVVADLAVKGHRNIVLVGGSLGATAAIIAAARNPRIAGVIADSPIASFESFQRALLQSRLDRLGLGWAPGVDVLSRMIVKRAAKTRAIAVQDALSVVAAITPRPLLLIHGGNDTAVSPDHSRDLAHRAGPTARLLIVEGADHVGSHTKNAAEYDRAIKSFLDSVRTLSLTRASRG